MVHLFIQYNISQLHPLTGSLQHREPMGHLSIYMGCLLIQAMIGEYIQVVASPNPVVMQFRNFQQEDQHLHLYQLVPALMILVQTVL